MDFQKLIKTYGDACGRSARAPRISPSQQAAIQLEQQAHSELIAGVVALTVERDELRARLAELEGQEPVAQVEVSVPHLRSIVVRDIPGAEIPAGWKLVPVEITEAMHVAAVKTIVRCNGNAEFPPRVWAAMLTSAPEAAR
jgi:hypothetical protein